MSSSIENQNFNPSWIGSAYRGGHGNGVGNTGQGSFGSRVLGEPDEQQDYPLAPPVFVDYRYGREDLLALVGKDSRPPEGLENCQELFVPQHQAPVSIHPLTEREQNMIQNNINSSKAMSSLTTTERNQVLASGGGTPNSGFQRAGGTPSGNGWTPVKGPGWSRGNSTNRGAAAGRGAFSGGFINRPSQPPNQPTSGTLNEDGNSPYGQRYVPRNARGAPPTGRGGSTAVPSFNTRAQGLYNPKDPKDRPRARIRSTSEDDAPAANGSSNTGSGWQTMRVGGRTDENGGGGAGNNGWARRNTTDSAPLPEWMNDSDDEAINKPASISREPSDERSPLAINPISSMHESRPRKEETSPDQRPAWTRQVTPSGIGSADTSQAAQDRGLGRSSQPASTSAGQTPSSAGYPLDQGVYSRGSSIMQPVAPPIPASPPKFYYLDPTKVERGPFEKDQMEQWFKIGYFETSLLLRKDTDREYKTLGELQQLNGAATPFDFRVPSPPPPVVNSQFSHISGWTPSNEMSNLAPYLFGAGQNTFNTPSIHNATLLQQLEQETQRRLREQQEAIYARLMVEQREKEELQMLELKKREEQLRAYQEEIQRREAAMKETAMEMEARLEMERLQLEEQAREVARERQRVAAIEEAKRREEEEKKRLEEEKIQREAEIRRQAQEKETKRIEEEERKKRAELAAEAERRRLEAAAREAATQLKQKEAMDKLRKEEELKQKKEQQKKDEEMAARIAKEEAERQRFEVTEEWEVAGKPKKEEKKERQKAAPWTSSSTPREKTMTEIMEEEERQAAAERRQIEAQRKEELRNQQSLQAAGTWTNAASRLNTNVAKTRSSPSSASAWGAISNEPVKVNPLLDGPSLTAANKTAPKKSAPVKSPTPLAVSKPKKPATPSLQQWAIGRMKQLNDSVEADVLYSFVADVDSPADVEDYVIGYLGDTKQVKEFVKEFIKKRSDAKGGKKTETAASVNSGSSEWATAAQTGKKKKGKGRTLVVDGSCLGFTPAADPNRTNKGEIETVPLPASSRR